MLRTHVEEALAELVALGSVSSDSFAGLRALLTPSDKRKPFHAGKRRRKTVFGIEDAGRWALIRRAPPTTNADGDALPSRAGQPPSDIVEHVVDTLLRRYGVVFWRLLQREAGWLPPWRDMLRVLRRLEARGDLRGGRFVAGVSGEQFALPEAVALLREARRAPRSGAFVSISAADPLNLVGIVLPGAKVPALASNRVLYRDGVPVATLVAGEIRWLETLETGEARMAADLLIKRQPATPLLAYLR
jgi:ATP-dependent Lhr-like helicase